MAAAVRSVWADNFAAESAILRAVAPRAVYAAINVQYPGCVVSASAAAGDRRCYYDLTAEERYKVVRANADELKPLQLGLAVRTADGGRFAWEFNLNEFDLAADGDMCEPGSVDYLRRRGMDFNALPWSGVGAASLGRLLWSSGLLAARPSWATFAGAYHVAYFARILMLAVAVAGGGGAARRLPADVGGFEEMVRSLLGHHVYDVRLLRGPLADVARQLGAAAKAMIKRMQSP
ncbi:probable CCR4-associated factor 1 homolog 9 [Oryza glaberrima]|uniref:probable CCR4-associated factor 1 homolog 9 n=1 Tax=Oryza glaberrima TaxID=4538 RepID=UPI00224C466D|nr:probable CCR4-associated factor 1 homolog 9 [Oryza glaberrima]